MLSRSPISLPRWTDGTRTAEANWTVIHFAMQAACARVFFGLVAAIQSVKTVPRAGLRLVNISFIHRLTIIDGSSSIRHSGQSFFTVRLPYGSLSFDWQQRLCDV